MKTITDMVEKMKRKENATLLLSGVAAIVAIIALIYSKRAHYSCVCCNGCDNLFLTEDDDSVL